MVCSIDWLILEQMDSIVKYGIQQDYGMVNHGLVNHYILQKIDYSTHG